VPSPISYRSADQKTFEAMTFRTASKEMVPLATTECPIVDDGNATPYLARLTTYNIPCTSDLLKKSCMSLGLLLQPFADPKDGVSPRDLHPGVLAPVFTKFSRLLVSDPCRGLWAKRHREMPKV